MSTKISPVGASDLSAWPKLKYVAKIKGGVGFPPEEQGQIGNELPFYKVNALESSTSDGALSVPGDTVSSITAEKLGAHIFKPGATVFAKVGAALLLNRFRQINCPACLDNNMMGLEPDENCVLPRYLMYALCTKDLSFIANPGAVPSVNASQIADERMFRPSIVQQTRIANFLDEQTARIDALIAEKERLVGTLKNLRAEAIDNTVLGGEIKVRGQPLKGLDVLGNVPRGWDVSRMKYELDYVTSGSRGWADYYADGGAIFIRIGNLTRDSITLDLADVQRVVLPDAAEGIRARVLPGDLLISITAYLGSVAVAPREIEEAYVSQHVSLARPNFVRALPDWLGYVVLSCIGKTFFDLQAYGGTKIQLSLDDVRELAVPLPSLDEQRRRLIRLEQRLAQLVDLEGHVTEHIARLREYRASLISAAVTGQLDIDNYGKGG